VVGGGGGGGGRGGGGGQQGELKSNIRKKRRNKKRRNKNKEVADGLGQRLDRHRLVVGEVVVLCRGTEKSQIVSQMLEI